MYKTLREKHRQKNTRGLVRGGKAELGLLEVSWNLVAGSPKKKQENEGRALQRYWPSSRLLSKKADGSVLQISILIFKLPAASQDSILCIKLLSPFVAGLL